MGRVRDETLRVGAIHTMKEVPWDNAVSAGGPNPNIHSRCAQILRNLPVHHRGFDAPEFLIKAGHRRIVGAYR